MGPCARCCPTRADRSVDVHEHYAARLARHAAASARTWSPAPTARRRPTDSRRGLQTPGDNRVFAALRDLADVVLVGWATAAAESYGPARPDVADPAPLGTASASCRSPSSAGRCDSTPARGCSTDNRPLVVTCADARTGRAGPSSASAPTCSSAATTTSTTRAVRRALADARADPGAVRGRPDDPGAGARRPASSTSCA